MRLLPVWGLLLQLVEAWLGLGCAGRGSSLGTSRGLLLRVEAIHGCSWGHRLGLGLRSRARS